MTDATFYLTIAAIFLTLGLFSLSMAFWEMKQRVNDLKPQPNAPVSGLERVIAAHSQRIDKLERKKRK